MRCTYNNWSENIPEKLGKRKAETKYIFIQVGQAKDFFFLPSVSLQVQGLPFPSLDQPSVDPLVATGIDQPACHLRPTLGGWERVTGPKSSCLIHKSQLCDFRSLIAFQPMMSDRRQAGQSILAVTNGPTFSWSFPKKLAPELAWKC